MSGHKLQFLGKTKPLFKYISFLFAKLLYYVEKSGIQTCYK